MKSFFLHDENGRITSTGECQDTDFDIQPQSGLALREGVAIYGVDYFDGSIVLRLPAKPAPYHTFNYTSKQWEDPRTPATEWPLVRAKRDALLSDTDWVITKAMEMGTPVPDAWRIYRQALRNLTLQADPFNLVWPVMPT